MLFLQQIKPKNYSDYSFNNFYNARSHKMRIFHFLLLKLEENNVLN